VTQAYLDPDEGQLLRGEMKESGERRLFCLQKSTKSIERTTDVKTPAKRNRLIFTLILTNININAGGWSSLSCVLCAEPVLRPYVHYSLSLTSPHRLGLQRAGLIRWESTERKEIVAGKQK
jgi:hypothetical protein